MNVGRSLFRIAKLPSLKREGWTALALTWLAAASATGQVEIPETLTGSFADITEFSFLTQEDQGGGSAFGSTAVVTGIPKFNPALGTLTGIRVSASYDYEASGDFFIDNVDSVTLETSGSMTNGQVQVSYDFVPIPEPGTTVMVALSALAIGLQRRRAPGGKVVS